MQFITTDKRIAVENFEIGLIYTVTFTGGRYFSGACIGKGADFVMFQRTAPELVYCLNMAGAADVESIEQTGGGGGTLNYNDLYNKPQINSVSLQGNISLTDLGIQPALSAEDPIPLSYVPGAISKSDVFGLGSSIPANTDLDTLTAPGVYFAANAATAGSLSNCPVNQSFRLVVTYHNSSSTADQILYSRGAGTIYRRLLLGGAWGAWFRFDGTQV